MGHNLESGNKLRFPKSWWYPSKIIQVMNDHDLVLKPMVTTGDPSFFFGTPGTVLCLTRMPILVQNKTCRKHHFSLQRTEQ